MAEVRRNLVHDAPSPLTRGRRLVFTGLAVALAFCLYAGACEEQKTIRTEEDLLQALIDTAGDYNKLLKWQDYDKMSLYVEPDSREEFLMALDEIEGRVQFEDIQISHARVVELEPGSPEANKKIREQNREGRVVVKLINATILPSTQVVTVRIAQDWVFKNETWYARFDLRDLLNP